MVAGYFTSSDPANNARMIPVWNQFIESGRSELVLGLRLKVHVLPNPGQQDPSQITLIIRYMKFHCIYTNASWILSHPMVTNLKKPIEVMDPSLHAKSPPSGMNKWTCALAKVYIFFTLLFLGLSPHLVAPQ